MLRVKTSYLVVNENVGNAQVCAVVSGSQRSIAFPFNVTFTFKEDSASMWQCDIRE